MMSDLIVTRMIIVIPYHINACITDADADLMLIR